MEVIDCKSSECNSVSDDIRGHINNILKMLAGDLVREKLLLSDNPNNLNTFIIQDIER